MENNFIQMVALAGHVVAYTIAPVFKQIIDCVQLYFTNGFCQIPFFLENAFKLSILCSCISPMASRILYCPLKRQLSLACRRYTYL